MQVMKLYIIEVKEKNCFRERCLISLDFKVSKQTGEIIQIN